MYISGKWINVPVQIYILMTNFIKMNNKSHGDFFDGRICEFIKLVVDRFRYSDVFIAKKIAWDVIQIINNQNPFKYAYRKVESY